MIDTYAVLYEGKRTLTPRSIKGPCAPERDEVQIDVAYNGICGTDLHIFHGAMDHRVNPPSVIGHEMSGTIVATGSDVTGWPVGSSVTVMPLDWCNDCPACSAGHNHVCHNLNFVGIDSAGAIQQRWNVRQDLLVALPSDLALDVAALTEPLAVAVHDVRRGHVQAGDQVVVIGGGPIGVLIALVCHDIGATAIVSEPDAGRRGLAGDLGVATIDPMGEDLVQHVEEWTEGKGADVVFEVSGTQPGVDDMLSVLRTRGVGVVVGIHNKAPAVDLFRMFWRELELKGARVYERSDFEQAVDLLAAGKIPAEGIISGIVPATSAQAGFERLDAGGSVLKLLIDCRAFGDD